MAIGDNLVEYYPLNEATGNRVGLHAGLTLTDGGSTLADTGLTYGNAAEFGEGDGQTLSRADNAAHSAGDIDLTIAFAFYLNSAPAYDYILLSKHTGGSSGEEYIFFKNSANQLTLRVRDSSDNSDTVIWTDDTLTTGVWYRALGYHDAVNNVFGLALNNGTPVTTSWSAGIRDGDNPFVVGNNALSGRIGPVARWNRVLDATDRTIWDNGGSLLTYAAIVTGSFNAAWARGSNVMMLGAT